MKYTCGLVTFLAASGLLTQIYAADVPTPLRINAPAPLYSWTNCYLGVEGGGSLGQSQHTAVTAPNPTGVGRPITNKFDMNGGIFGGTIGCNYQLSVAVFGIENDFSWTGIKGSANDIAPFNTAAKSTTSERWLNTARVRVGFAWNQFLIYGTGGAAFANASVLVCGAVECASDSQIQLGWTAGAGVEWAVWTGPGGTWTFKVEYLHADLGSGRYINPPIVAPGGTIETRDVTLTNDIVRGGVNWKFNWP
jgi:outer membrane immunogenic protein